MALPKHIAKIVNKPRKVACLVCGKSCEIVGTATKKLCETHRLEYKKNPAKWKKTHGKNSGKETVKSDRVSSVRGNLRSEPQSKVVPLRDSLPSAQNEIEQPTEKPMAAKSEARHTYRPGSFSEAIALITEPEKRREGFRHGWLGTTGSGKTTSLKTFLRDSNQSGVLTLIHDDTKLEAQYAGHVCHSVREAPDECTTLVFRGDVFKGTVVHPEYVAALALDIAKTTREPVRVLVDEVRRACSKGGMVLQSKSVETILTQGRALGVSLLWSNQSPIVPKELIDQSSTIAIGQLGPRALNYLDERLMFERELLDVVPNLKQGQFVIAEQGRNWNKTIYQTPPPSTSFDHARKPYDYNKNEGVPHEH